MTDQLANSNLPGMVTVSGNRVVVDPVEWIQGILQRPGVWKAENTDGQVPIVTSVDKYRNFSMHRNDLVVVQKDPVHIETQSITYAFQTRETQMVLRCFTRSSRMHMELMVAEAERALMRFRQDSYGSAAGTNPNMGAVWIREASIDPLQYNRRLYWEQAIYFTIVQEWVPISTQTEQLSGS